MKNVNQINLRESFPKRGKRFKTMLLALSLCLAVPGAQASSFNVSSDNHVQDLTVSGTVTDNTGAPLPGATVLEAGTMNGTQTDFDGNFTLTVSDANAVLQVSYIGFSTKEISVNGSTQLTISLEEDAAELDEVVLVGYGGQKKKEITSAVVSVKSEDFNRGNVSDPVQLLQGKVAGLQVGRPGGNPNQPFVVRLRGINSLSGDSAPLVVIDGVLGGSLEALDPNDIESIEVLKDASAAAIYGTRASAGVLIVTTKSGKGAVAKPRLSITSQLSFENIANTPEIASAEQYLDLGGQDLGSKTDWLERVSRTGVSKIYNIAYGGSSESGLSYQASLNYRDNEGVIENSAEFEQLIGRVNISQKLLDDKLTLKTILSTTSRKENQGFQQSLTQALFYNPTAPVFNDDGSFFETQDQDRYNPVAINDQNVLDRKLNQHVVTFGADYRVMENLVLSGIYTQQRTSELIGEYSTRDAFFGGGLVNGWARRATVDNTYNQFDWTLTYNDELGDLDYRVTLGQSFNNENIQSAVVSNTDFITDEFSYNNIAAGQGINRNGVVPAEGNVAQPQNFVGSNQEESISDAYFARLNLNYDDAFFLSGTYRREGSSRFGANNRWGNFWAISGGSDLANVFKIPMDQLKLRIGYGVTGTLPNVFTGYLGTLRLTSGGFANGEFISAVTPATGANPDLKWEEKAELNIGLDFALFDRRLSGSIDFFQRNTTDLLNVVNVPSPPNAVPTQLRNVGELETSGAELQMSYRAVSNENFNWTIDANVSTSKTKLIEFNPESEQTIIRSRGLEGAVAIGPIQPVWTTEGEEIGQIYAQPFVRYAENGDPIVLLKDGTEAVFDPAVFLDEARNVGDALPDLFVGLTNTITYKNFDFNVFIRGVFGHSMINETRAAYENVSGVAIRNLVVTEGEFNESITVPHYSTRFVEDASFVRIDNMTLGYTLPNFQNSPFSKFRIFVNGQNLATFTGYKGADPDVRYFDPVSNSEGRRGNSFGGNALFPGIDRYITFLPTSIFSLGINLEF
ncbi:MAG: SusC/RagA family TonB-linked outer membrane protein [Flagellimonas sp.]